MLYEHVQKQHKKNKCHGVELSSQHIDRETTVLPTEPRINTSREQTSVSHIVVTVASTCHTDLRHAYVTTQISDTLNVTSRN